MLNETVASVDRICINAILVSPDLVNVLVLAFGLYGMYNGINIMHPVYAVLFLNLAVALASSTTNICVALFLPSEMFMRASNGNCWITLVFYCSCWSVNSATRYVYILFNKMLYSKLANIMLQTVMVVMLTLICFFLFTSLLIGTAVYQGKKYLIFSFLFRLKIETFHF